MNIIKWTICLVLVIIIGCRSEVKTKLIIEEMEENICKEKADFAKQKLDKLQKELDEID